MDEKQKEDAPHQEHDARREKGHSRDNVGIIEDRRDFSDSDDDEAAQDETSDE